MKVAGDLLALQLVNASKLYDKREPECYYHFSLLPRLVFNEFVRIGWATHIERIELMERQLLRSTLLPVQPGSSSRNE
jgi:hypothetical protein